MIDVNQAATDIKELEVLFKQFGAEWEEGDGYSYYCTEVAEKELDTVLQKMNHYEGFTFKYDESEYVDPKYDNWYQDQTFSEDDLYSCNVTEDNYGLADAVACDMKAALVDYLKAAIEAQQ